MALTDSLTAYYKLDESSGNAADATGNGYTLTNTGSTAYASALINNGADFVPTGDSLNNNSVLGALSYPRSFQSWVKFDSVAGATDRAVIALGDGSTHYYALKLRDSDDHIVFRSNNATQAADVDTGVVATVGTWYHCVVIQNSSTSVTIYINNTATNTAEATFVATVIQDYLGYLGRSSAWYLDGLIDECGIWNRALTGTEVGQLYNSGAGLAYPLTVDSSNTTNFFALM